MSFAFGSFVIKGQAKLVYYASSSKKAELSLNTKLLE